MYLRVDTTLIPCIKNTHNIVARKKKRNMKHKENHLHEVFK